MKTKTLLLALAFGTSACLLPAQDNNTPPTDGQRPPQREGGSGAHNNHGGFHVLPPGAQKKLNLTAEQQKQVAALEAEVKAKLEKILTSAQLEQLKQLHPPRPQGGPGEAQAGGNGGSAGAPGGEEHSQPPSAE